MDIIKINNVGFGYSYIDEDSNKTMKTETLKNINLNIETGEFVAILGHNGSGKSTLAKIMNALLLPDSGEALIIGLNPSNESNIFEIRRNVGMVFQNPDNQIIATIVEEDVAFGPENLSIPPDKIRPRVDSALKNVGMENFALANPAYLSGGQKQRVAIAGVLAMKPKCIIFDESTAMLDPNGRKEVLDTAIKLNKEDKITIILITHFMDEATLADRVIVVNDGQAVMGGPPKSIFSQINELKALSLDVPQITELAYLLSEKGLNINTDILTIEEMVGALCNYN
ncbi:MAG: energy-coupling factor transporter ATPase [Clostridiales bacterium]|jgi:energy-coupling factor transport system ATP-binding protein|nr:energy-coupling factor transporter ATPase [Clostridiales bacterium]